MLTSTAVKSSAARPATAAGRLASVDALRGFSIVWLVGGEGAVRALAEMSKSGPAWIGVIGGVLEYQIEHAPWEGFRFYDLIFPLLIFVTGIAIALSLPGLVEREGMWRAQLRVARRFILLFALGVLFYGGVAKYWPDVRLLGVLQRIALCYLFASLIFLYSGRRGALVATVLLLTGYWAAMTLVPVPGIGAGSFAPDANLADWIDANYLPGKLWDGTRIRRAF